MASSVAFMCSDFEFLRLEGNSVKPVEADDVSGGLVLVHKRKAVKVYEVLSGCNLEKQSIIIPPGDQYW